MPPHDQPHPHLDAALARSILACPASVELVVDGYPHAGDDTDLGMRDDDGTPTFSCRPGSPMALAAQGRRGALITMRSGLGPPGTSEREDTLTVTGRLESGGTDYCTCCAETRVDVALQLDFVLVSRAEARDGVGGLVPVRVPLRAYRSPEHQLNRGYLQRAVEHANDCHQEDLRQLVATTTCTPLDDLLGVHLTELTCRGVDMAWVDVDGAHRTGLCFSRPARTVNELGLLLRHELHAGIC